MKSKGVKIGVGISTLIMAGLLVAGAMIPGYVPSPVESTTGNPGSIAFNPELENGHAYLEYASIDGSQEKGSYDTEKLVSRIGSYGENNTGLPTASKAQGISGDDWRFDTPFYDDFEEAAADSSSCVETCSSTSNLMGRLEDLGFTPDHRVETPTGMENDPAGIKPGVTSYAQQRQQDRREENIEYRTMLDYAYHRGGQSGLLEDDSPYFDEFRVGVNALNLAVGNGTMTASYHQQRLADSVDERQEVLRLQEEMSK